MSTGGEPHLTEIPDAIDRADLAMLCVADRLAQKLEAGEGGNLTPLEIYEDDVNTLGIGEQKMEESKPTWTA